MSYSSFSRGRCHLWLACSVLSVSLILPLAAQDDQSAQIDTQQDLINRQDNQALEQQIPYRIVDPELGEIDLVARAPRPKMFTFSTAQTFNYTSNAFLTQSGERDAFFWNGRLNASFVPYATRDFTPRLTFEQDFFRYTRFSRLDFDSQILQLDLKYDLNKSDTWFIDGSYAVSRLYSPRGSAGEFYRYGLANLSLNHYRPLGSLPIYLLCSAGAYARNGEPSTFDRIAPYLSVAALYQPIEHLQVSAFLRPEVPVSTLTTRLRIPARISTSVSAARWLGCRISMSASAPRSPSSGTTQTPAGSPTTSSLRVSQSLPGFPFRIRDTKWGLRSWRANCLEPCQLHSAL